MNKNQILFRKSLHMYHTSTSQLRKVYRTQNRNNITSILSLRSSQSTQLKMNSCAMIRRTLSSCALLTRRTMRRKGSQYLTSIGSSLLTRRCRSGSMLGCVKQTWSMRRRITSTLTTESTTSMLTIKERNLKTEKVTKIKTRKTRLQTRMN